MRKIKVGNLTLALTLMALGIGTLAHNLADSAAQKVAIRNLLDYWPLILAILGIEILAKQALARRSEGSTTSLDGLSVFILLLIVATAGIWQHGSITFNWGNWQSVDLEDLANYSTTIEDSLTVTENTHSLEVDLPGFAEVVINNSDTDQVEVEVQATGYAPNAERAQELVEQLELEAASGSTLVIDFDTPPTERYERLEYVIIIKAPARLAARVNNSRFGQVTVSGRQNDVEITAQHSDVFVESVQGDVVVENRFGRVELRQITGDVEVENEHEELLLVGIDGSAVVKSSHGSIQVEQVTGDLSAETAHERLRVSNVGGNVRLINSYDSIEVYNVAGDCHIRGRHSEVEARDVGGALDLETSYADATLRDISGKTDAINQHGEIHYYSTRLVTAEVNLQTSYEDIYVDIPEDSSVNVHAETRHGTISAASPMVVTKDGTVSEAEGKLGSGDHRVWIETSNGDVRITFR